MKKILYVFTLLFVMFTSSKVMAFTTSLGSNINIDANSSFNVTMSLSGATDLIALDAVLSYDKDKLELVNSGGLGGWQTTVASKIVGANSNGLNGSGSIVSLKFKAKSTFLAGEKTTISVTNVKGSNSNVERQTGNDASITVSVNVPKSGNNKLASLSVDGKSVSGFNSDKVTYDLGTTTNGTIDISATVEDSKATVSGIGKKTINYGKNTFSVVVTAENGSKKTYTIIITKPDNRSSDNTLSSLSIKGLDLKFNKNTTNYSFKVEHNVNSVVINAKANHDKATVSGVGTKNLKDYVNTFSVVVTAENGSKKTYTIKIMRKDVDGNLGALSKDNTLKSLIVDGYDIKFNKDTLEYSLEVDNLVDSIKVTAVLNDDKATYEILGNDKLNVGTNSVKINVTAENGDIKTYVINVTRKSDLPSTSLNDLENVLGKTTANEIIIDIKDENTTLDSKILSLMKKSGKKFIINNYANEVINYTWIIDGKKIGDINSIDSSLRFKSDNEDEIDKLTNYVEKIFLNFSHEGKLPDGTEIKVYVGDKYKNYSRLKLYYYNKDKNKMELVKDEIEVLDGYVQFEIEHCSEYILSMANLNFGKDFNIFMLISILEFIIIIGYIGYIKFIYKDRKKK